MKRMLIGLAMLVGAEGAAQACSCIPNAYDPVAERETANRLAGRVVALIEVEVVEGYNSVTRQGEVMRVRHILAGEAPASFRMQRSGGGSCDVRYRIGTRHYFMLSQSVRQEPGDLPEFADQGYCATFLLGSATFRQMLIEAMLRPRAGSPGPDSLAGAPCANTV